MKSFWLIFLLLPSLVNAQIITTVAGNGFLGFMGDGGPATNAKLHIPGKVIFDDTGNLYIADTYNERIRKVQNGTGIITTIVGMGTAGYNGDNIPATSAQLNDPCGMAFDMTGNLFIADGLNQRIRKVNLTTGIITTVAGNGYGAGGLGGFSGDGGPATSAELNCPGYIIFDTVGNLYISDHNNRRIRKVSIISGIISTIAGSGSDLYYGDGGAATSAGFVPEGIAFDNSSNLYIADTNSAIRKVDASTGIIITVVGTGIMGYSGDSAAATSAQISDPFDIFFDHNNNFYIAEWRGRIRKVDTSGIIFTTAGTTDYGYNGDGILADTAELNETTGICLDDCGNLYIADASNERIRKVTFSSIPIALTNTITASPTDTICSGATVTFNATATASSGAITYEWYVNGSIVSATSSSYTYSPANDDSIRCVVTATNPCTSAMKSSNSIYMVVNPYSAPTITVTAPASALVGATVTVSAAVAGAGSSYSINWYDNAVLFNTTTVPVVTYVKGTGVDVITATVVPGSEGGCYDSTTSGAVSVAVSDAGITTPYPLLKTGGEVYPNPVSDVVHVDGDVVSYKMISVVGAVLLHGDLKIGSNNIDVGGLPPGVYVLDVTGNGGGRTVTKIVKQ